MADRPGRGAKSFRELRTTMSPERQSRIRRRTEGLLEALPLAELRQARQLTQQQLAAMMDTDQGNVSKLERQTDMYVSTLRRYVEAMGGTLEIVARFPDGDVEIEQFGMLGR